MYIEVQFEVVYFFLIFETLRIFILFKMRLIILSFLLMYFKEVHVFIIYSSTINSNHILKGLITSETFNRDLGLVVTNILDTAEDAALHLRSKFTRKNSADISTIEYSQATRSGEKPRLVVIGSGWSAHAFMKIIEAVFVFFFLTFLLCS